MIVDDSVVVRGLFSRWLSEMPDVEIVGVHRNGVESVARVASQKPDIILLDIEMPEMDGLTALPLLLREAPSAKVLIVSGVSPRGADVTLRCLMRGATDYLCKPSSMREITTSLDFRTTLTERVRAIGGKTGSTSTTRCPVPTIAAVPSPLNTGPTLSGPALHRSRITPAHLPIQQPAVARLMSRRDALGQSERLRQASASQPELLVIGASTGGPPAIAAFLFGLGSGIKHIPVVIAQHMPATFTMLFADHLKRHFGLDAVEVIDRKSVV